MEDRPDRAWALPLPAIVASIYGANAPTGVGVLTVLSTGAIASSSTIPVPELADPGTLVVGIAVDALGEIFVTEQLTVSDSGTLGTSAPPTGAILVFAPGAGAAAVPIRTISGASTLLTTPQFLTVDASGDLYVAQGSGDVLEFNAGASGNVAPVRTVKGFFGKKTGVGFVHGMGVDLGGNLYLMNGAAGNAINNILVFSPTQSGDVAPIRTIAGSATLLQRTPWADRSTRQAISMSSRGRRYPAPRPLYWSSPPEPMEMSLPFARSREVVR